MLPRIVATDDTVGFHWAFPDGRPARLVDLLSLPDAEPDRWLPTHLSALDDVLIEVARRYGQVLGGGRRPYPDERAGLGEAYPAIDRACAEYEQAHAASGLPDDLRAGQILGTAALMSIRCRQALGMMGPAPFDGQLDQPAPGLVSGRAGLYAVDDAEPWRGARWLVVTDDERRLPATLSMLLRDSSGIDKQASLDEHRAALAAVVEAAGDLEAIEPMAASGAIDWLLFDWVMAHRESEDSGAVEIASGRIKDAAMLVSATAASVRVRRRFDPALIN